MSHRDSCPPRWEAEREGERSFERGYGSNPYRDSWGDRRCPDAERNWDYGYRAAERRAEEEALHQHQIQRRRAEERAMEDEYWRQEEQRYYDEQMSAQIAAEQTAYYDEIQAAEAIGAALRMLAKP